MFKVKGEGLSPAETTAITNICSRVAAAAAQAANMKAGNRGKWFGTMANSDVLLGNLRTMDKYLNKQCTQLTFVRKATGQIIDSVNAEDSDYGQVLPNVFSTTVGFKQTTKHVSSGLRIFAMNELIRAIATNDIKEQLNYVYHEVSHKVLDTMDYKYGKPKCKALAINNPGRAVKNADNYGYFICEVA
ncbi:MAG TPA: M35 family metallo-endopeptidase [Planctomycetota bacterium]|nr:M35 family metallo-endopeptidase [Planctomycetota bacterium]